MIYEPDLTGFNSFIRTNQITLPNEPPPVVSINEIISKEPDPAQTLLGNRWLCRGGAAIVVGPSGIGKSSMSLQQDLCWARGQEAFGIKPAMPLRMLTIQAENDEGDLCEIGRGVIRGLKIPETEIATLGDRVLYVCERSRVGAQFVSETLRPLLETYKPDIVRIDPLQAYAGADITQAKEAATLLRNQINPLLMEFNCGLILVHHTPKTSGKDTSGYRTSDWMYAGAGSHEIVNFARAVLVIDPLKENGVFRLIAAKRGQRIGWETEFGKQTERWFKWADDGVYWQETQPPVVIKDSPDTIYNLVPPSGDIEKSILLARANNNGLAQSKCKALLAELITDGDLIETLVPAKGRREKVMISRNPEKRPLKIGPGKLSFKKPSSAGVNTN